MRYTLAGYTTLGTLQPRHGAVILTITLPEVA